MCACVRFAHMCVCVYVCMYVSQKRCSVFQESIFRPGNGEHLHSPGSRPPEPDGTGSADRRDIGATDDAGRCAVPRRGVGQQRIACGARVRLHHVQVACIRI